MATAVPPVHPGFERSGPDSSGYWDAGGWDPDHRVYVGACDGQVHHRLAVEPSAPGKAPAVAQQGAVQKSIAASMAAAVGQTAGAAGGEVPPAHPGLVRDGSSKYWAAEAWDPDGHPGVSGGAAVRYTAVQPEVSSWDSLQDSYWDSGGWATGDPSLSRRLSSTPVNEGKFSEPNSGCYWDAGQWDPDERVYVGAAAGQINHLRAVDPNDMDTVGGGARLSRAWAGGWVSENLGLGTSVGPPIDLATAAIEHRPTMKEQYEIMDQTVGSGSFGVVRRAKHRPSEKPCVVKAVKKAQAGDQFRMDMVDAGLGEKLLRMSKETPSVNIAQHFDILEGPAHFYVVMEELTGPELLQYVEDLFPVMENVLQDVMKQILTALVHLHNVVHLFHRDIKLANFRFRGSPIESDLVLLDFGLSGSTLQAWDGAVCGTPMYMAPELVAQTMQMPLLTAMDLWAVGVILYVLLTGDSPFQDEEVQMFGRPAQAQEVERVRERALASEELRCASEESIDLLKQLLVIDPEARLTAVQGLDHRWFSFAAGARRVSVSGAKYRAVREAGSRQASVRSSPSREASVAFTKPTWDMELPLGQGLERIVSVGDDCTDD